MAHHIKMCRSALSWSIVVLLAHLQSAFSASTGEEAGQKYELNKLVDNLQYSKYLKEVLELLKTDDSLKTKVNFESFSTGNLAEHLDNAHDTVRTKLDELKRQELYRIRQISEELKRRGQSDKVIRHAVRVVTKHLDLKDLAKFGTEDLRKLILQANAELALLDTERREKFKEYEMHKVLEFEELFKRLTPVEQEVVKKNKQQLLAEHKRRRPSHMPASKEHLLKVWEQRDKMNKDNFNIKTFFHLHDLDGNGFLDEYEIKMLLENEVLDYHDQSAPDFDPKVREEDLERMREYAFTTIDTDKDHLINLEEFIENSKKTGYDDHVFWESVRSVPVYTEQEYAAYAVLHREEVSRMIDEGHISLPPIGVVKHNPHVGKIMMKKLNIPIKNET